MEPKTETWRDAETCPLHEDYENGCLACFAEAVEGGVSWLVDEALPGTEAVMMPRPSSLCQPFELRFEGARVFSFTYAQGKALDLPDYARERLEELIEGHRQTVAFWDERVYKLERAYAKDPSPDLNASLHAAYQSRGAAGKRLSIVESWRLDIGPEKAA